MIADARKVELVELAAETLKQDITPARMKAVAAMLVSVANSITEEAEKGGME